MAAHELTLDEFKARIPLADLVGRYVKLARRGREHVGLCPFHKEKSPSFNVVEDKGFYHCFGCGAHGTAVDFVMAMEGLTFAEALQRTAEITGIAAPRRGEAARPDAHARLFAANEAAAAWFAAALVGPDGAEARAYLERRGVERASVRRFGLGFAPDGRQGLRAAMQAAGFSEAELLAAGLLARPETGEPYDRFRHRLMFPIADERGRVVGFGGRALGEARAKYLNTADTELFHKGELLYNLHQAAAPARERREVVLAEGYMDVIALAQAGFGHAVAPLGTAVTERQLQGLWRLAAAPTVCLDGDRAGLAAAMRAAERALPLMRGERTLRFAVLPEGEDPDSFLRRHGSAAMGGLLSRAHTLSQMIWRLEAQPRCFATPEARAALAGRLRSLSRLADDPDLRRSLWDQFQALLDERSPRRARPSSRAAASPATWEGVGAVRLAAGISRRAVSGEARLLAPVLADPAWLAGCEDELADIQFSDPKLDGLRQEIVAWIADSPNLDAATLQRHLLRYGFGPVLDQFAADLTQPRPPAPGSDDVARRQGWRDTLVAIRQRAALRRERPTEDDLRLRDGVEVNRRFYRLDSLLNRSGADEGESSDGSPGVAG